MSPAPTKNHPQPATQPSQPAGSTPKKTRQRRPWLIQFLLLFFPCGIILGIVVALLNHELAKGGDKDSEQIGRGQDISTERLADIQSKLQTVAAIQESNAQHILRSYIKGTLGTQANAGLEAKLFTPHQNQPEWLSIHRESDSNRAGLTLWCPLPQIRTSSAASRQQLAALINNIEHLALQNQAQRAVTLIFHPASQTPTSYSPQQRQQLLQEFNLPRGGEQLNIQFSPQTDLTLQQQQDQLIIPRASSSDPADILELAQTLANWFDFKLKT